MPSVSLLLRRVAVLVVASALVTTAACGPLDDNGDGGDPGDQDRPIRPGGELRVALAEEPDLLDPTLARTLVGRIVFVSICEKLYDVDQDLNLVPQLAAELPDVSEDGLTMTIPVREGVMFADGTPLDAEAVKTSLDRHRELDGSARASELASVDSVESVDEMTVQVTLNAPFAPLTATLADRSGMIMSPTALAEQGEDFGTDPVCVGPFRFSDRVAQDRIEVVKDPNYYDAENVHLDQVTYRIIADSTTRFNNLRSGDVEVLERTAPIDVAAVESDPSLQLISSESLGYQGVTINVGNADGITEPPGPLAGDLASPLSESNVVRQALELSLDREALNQVVFVGQYSPACGPISPASPLSSDAAQACSEHDPAAAMDLLAQAGIETPVQVDMMIGTDAQARRLGEAIQAQAGEGGFDIQLNPTEFSSALDLADQGNFQMFAIGWSGRVDPDGNIASFLTTQAPLNTAGYSNPEADRLIEAARASTDLNERRQLYGELHSVVRPDAPIIYLYRQKNLTGVVDTVAGVEVFGDGLVRLAHAGFVEEAE
ncbi:MAG: ABC transporter substrate-binding protein [Micromonosporaceae bacterium]|nr:ABC transporter substrate-binding protein [Micromonosporaceae bacterium]